MIKTIYIIVSLCHQISFFSYAGNQDYELYSHKNAISDNSKINERSLLYLHQVLFRTAWKKTSVFCILDGYLLV